MRFEGGVGAGNGDGESYRILMGGIGYEIGNDQAQGSIRPSGIRPSGIRHSGRSGPAGSGTAVDQAQRRTTDPQVSPAPKPVRSRMSSFSSRPERTASSRAIGLVADEVLA